MEKIQREQDAFNAQIPKLIAAGHAGKYVIFRDGQVHGVFATEAEAYAAAIEKFGTTGGFLLDLVAEKKSPEVISFSYMLGLCRVS